VSEAKRLTDLSATPAEASTAVPARSAPGGVVAVVLSDGDPARSQETARDALRCRDRARIVEADPTVAGAITELAAGDHDVDVVTTRWRGHRDPVRLAGEGAAWALVLAAGERLAARGAVSVLSGLQRATGPRGVELSGQGRQLRLLPVPAPAADATATAVTPDASAAFGAGAGSGPAPGSYSETGAVAERVTVGQRAAAVTPSCPVCGSEAGFSPLPACFVDGPAAAGFTHPIGGWELLNVEAYACRGCGASDRDRLIWLYLQAHLPAEPDGTRMLEIAPAPALRSWLRARLGAGYRSGDLFMPGVDDRVDLCAMDYPGGSFDWLLCSHVLEHVPDDVQAMREIRRVLRPEGRAVLLVPISQVADAIDEDPGLTDPQARLARFGQDDHVRLYHREGFVHRLRTAGLAVEVVTVADLGSDLAARHAIPSTGALYVVRP
jgi:SAM-dependent methyltransferase